VKIAMVNPPFPAPWLGKDAWITVPPQGYGGIQWIVANLIDGLVERGHRVVLLGAPGSVSWHPLLQVIDAGAPDAIRSWLERREYDLVHDHSNGRAFAPDWVSGVAYVSTHHFTGIPTHSRNCVYSSMSQRRLAGAGDAPVVRIPVNTARYRFSCEKQRALLFLGRISPWKGAVEAAQFASVLDMRLWLAGPRWEADYYMQLLKLYGRHIIDYGEVGGEKRQELLASARAVLVLSQPVRGPWGGDWHEPGATIVSEAAASGTPVVASDNGCLAEIVPHVGVVIPASRPVTAEEAQVVMDRLPSPGRVREFAEREWSVGKIAAQYEEIYQQILRGVSWDTRQYPSIDLWTS
jgi:glycosyltransferase involved in cell wall biosynthesis